MKNILVIMILAGSGYWYYNNNLPSPLLGKWAPDEEALLNMAYKNGMPPSQANSIKKLVNNSRMVVKNDGKITYKFGEVGGDFLYESTPRSDGCFDLDIAQLGYFKACVENGMLAMHSNKDGGVEHYRKM